MASREEVPSQEETGFSTPGYITHQFYAIDGKKSFVRNVIIPESFFVELEKTVVKSMGYEGKKELYRIGKQFGYHISIVNRFPRGNITKLALYAVFKFFEIAYAKKLTTVFLDSVNKIVDVECEQLVVISKDDMGYMQIGAGCGIFSYIAGDYSLESTARKISEGKHSVMTGSKELLKEKGLEVIECDKLPQSINFETYMAHNTPQINPSSSLKSFNQLLAEGIVSYEPGIMKLKSSDERLIPLEISILFNTEETFDEKVLIDSSYASFYNIGLSLKKNEQQPYENLMQLLSAFGFGLIQFSEEQNRISLLFHGYPWFPGENKNRNFGFIKGAVIGFLNGNTNKNYELKSVSSKLVSTIFDVLIDIEISDS